MNAAQVSAVTRAAARPPMPQVRARPAPGIVPWWMSAAWTLQFFAERRRAPSARSTLKDEAALGRWLQRCERDLDTLTGVRAELARQLVACGYALRSKGRETRGQALTALRSPAFGPMYDLLAQLCLGVTSSELVGRSAIQQAVDRREPFWPTPTQWAVVVRAPAVGASKPQPRTAAPAASEALAVAG